MTDIELQRRKVICEVAGVDDIGDLSDGFHTFNSLYEQRMILFAALVKAYKEKAWKSYRHEDGEYCFGGGWFIVGIDTPEGSYTYHYENKYWDMFDCVDLPRARHWDGHTEDDAETRLMSLEPVTESVQSETHDKRTETRACDCVDRRAAIRWIKAECNPYGKPTLDYETSCRIMEHLDRMPPVQPERKKGKWTIKNGKLAIWYECSECKRMVIQAPFYNFCPNCGADMRGETDESD